MSEDKEINCIYCEKNKDKATFNGREHVIPKLMGSFKNNLTIDRVCDNCNSKIFNPLETKFKEDTEEGIVDVSEEDDVQLQRAIDLLKTWRIFKQLPKEG